MFKVEFSTGNAAFHTETEGETPEPYAPEVEAILGEIAYRVREGSRKGAIRDSNGNTVGEWSWTP